MSQTKTILLWGCRIVTSVILLQTLYFKFSGHEESVKLFTTLGVEPWGRITLGCIELLVAIALLIPRFSLAGSFFAVGILGGAVMTHLTIIGIESNGDGGALFIMALISLTTASSAFIIQWQQRNSVKH